ncbi:hypothetical protein [Candidatus Enterococcus ferrettii]|uniref:Uncharacterized protein n=1 Tax=Candidatus Enterococcus ferrettii TaxID=2815324 RepID=A0ABV0EN16_9ENTE|nr:hypothetical protein [Enterococcus sp. 665A]MBO1342305.1 hypothetical protein [Enterococcus sp. 665A]
MSSNKKKNSWFFNKSIVDEINAIPENRIEELGSNVYSMEKNGEKPVQRPIERTSERPAEPPIEKNSSKAAIHPPEVIRLQDELQRMTEERERELIQQQTDRRIEVQKLMNEQERLRSALSVVESEKEQAQQQTQTMKSEITNLRETLKEQADAVELERVNQQLKEELIIKDQKLGELNQIITEKETALASLLENSDQVVDQVAIQQMKVQLEELQKENKELKEEAIRSQLEIGEVLVSARKQANRTVEKAKMDAEMMIRSAEEDLEVVYDRAKEISFEVNESKRDVLEIFKELQQRVDKLANTKLNAKEE